MSEDTVAVGTVDRARRQPQISRPRRRAIALAVVLLIVPGLVALAGFARHGQAPAAPSWVAVDAPHTVVHALTRAPWGTLYAGTSQAVYASTEGGAAWHPLGRGLPATAFEAWNVAAVSGPAGEAVLVATGNGRVYRLARGSTHWAQTGPPIGTFSAYALFPLPRSAVVLAGSDRGIFRSTDGGRSWRRAAALGGDSAGVTAFARDPASGAIYAGLAGLPQPLRVSLDGGQSWRIPAAPLPPPSVEALLATSGHIYAGVMGAPAGHAAWIGGRDGFTVWASGLPQGAHGMALAVAHGQFLVGTMGVGVYSRTAQSAWSRLGHGPGDGVVTSLLALPGAHPTVLAGTDNGIYRLQFR